MDPIQLPEAPGARAARVCGVAAIVASVTCVGIPVGIVLGIVALVKNAGARRREREQPAAFRRSSAAGLALGIAGLVTPVVMLPFAGIVSAIAIPALLGQRERARELACKAALSAQLAELAAEYLRQPAGADPAAKVRALQQRLAATPAKNVYDPARPACRAEIALLEATSEDEVQYQLEPQAKVPGQLVFAICFPPNAGQPGYLAGAVRTRNATSPVLCQVEELH